MHVKSTGCITHTTTWTQSWGHFFAYNKLLFALLYRLGYVNIYDANERNTKTQLKVGTGSTECRHSVIKPLPPLLFYSNINTIDFVPVELYQEVYHQCGEHLASSGHHN